MESPRRRACAWIALVCSLVVSRSVDAAEPNCTWVIARSDVVACALRTNPSVEAERQGLEAVQGREITASVVLPSNPVVFATLGRRTGSPIEPDATTWSASLSQELELAGQRGARRHVVAGENEMQRARLT